MGAVLVQSKQFFPASAGTAQTLSLDGATVAGNTVVVVVAIDRELSPQVGVPAITGFTKVAEAESGANWTSSKVAIFVKRAAASLTDMEFTCSNSVSLRAMAYEYSGLDDTSPIDFQSGASASYLTAYSVTVALSTPVQLGGGILFSGLVNNNGNTPPRFTASFGETEDVDDDFLGTTAVHNVWMARKALAAGLVTQSTGAASSPGSRHIMAAIVIPIPPVPKHTLMIGSD